MASLRNELEGLLSRPEGACYLASRGDARAVLALLGAAKDFAESAAIIGVDFSPRDRLNAALAAFDEEEAR